MRTPTRDEFPGRLFAIGDVHGCSTALETLLDAIVPGPDDTLVFLGDLIDHGPASRGVIERLMTLSGECRVILIGGNHEEMLFDAQNGREEIERWERSGGQATRANYPGCGDGLILPDHMDFLKTRCRDYLETDRFLFVHANYYANRPMSEQSGHTLRWEFADPREMAPHYSGKTAVVGHTTRADGEILDLGFLVMIDTGAWTGGFLTALEVGSGEVIQASQADGPRRPPCRRRRTSEGRAGKRPARDSQGGTAGSPGGGIRRGGGRTVRGGTSDAPSQRIVHEAQGSLRPSGAQEIPRRLPGPDEVARDCRINGGGVADRRRVGS